MKRRGRVYILDNSSVKFHLRWGCKATFNRAGKPENDPSSLYRASFYVKTTQDKSPRHARLLSDELLSSLKLGRNTSSRQAAHGGATPPSSLHEEKRVKRNLCPINFCLQFDTECLIFCGDSFRIANIKIILF